MIDGILGIDVSENTLDVSISSSTKGAHQELREYILMDGTIAWIG